MRLVKVNELFSVRHGNKLDKNKMDENPSDSEESILFIGRSRQRNGLSGFVKRKPNLEPFQGGLITVALGGSALSSFVQPRPFYTAQNVDVLIPKKEMSLDVKLYYCLCIRANRFRYTTYGREANRTLKYLLVPSRADIPRWVHGNAHLTIAELYRELANLREGC